MTGDSENEIERPGDSPVPSAEPRPDGENSFRPFRGWASAYQPPPPSLWSRIAGLFSRKPKGLAVEEEIADAPSSLLADAAAMGVETPADPGDDAPVAPPDDFSFPFAREEAKTSAEAELEFVSVPNDRDEDEAVIEAANAHDDDAAIEAANAHDDDAFDAAFDGPLPSRVGEPARPGFFARLFSRRSKDPIEPMAASDEEMAPDDPEVAESIEAPAEPVDEPVHEGEAADPFQATATVDVIEVFETFEPIEPAAPVEPEIPGFLQEPPRHSRPVPAFESRSTTPTDRPNLDDPAFFIPEDAGDPPGYAEPSLDDALPAAPDAHAAPEVALAADASESWSDVPADEPATAPKQGFFSKLFGRKTKPVEPVAEEAVFDAPIDADADVVAQADESLSRADEFFADDTDRSDERFAPPSFATMDEALPPLDDAITTPEPAPAAATSHGDFLFGDTIDPADVQPAFDSATMEEIVDARPTVETTPARDTLKAAALDEESTDEFVQPVPPEVDAAAEAERPPFFVPKFRSFYNEIVLYKHQKSQFTGGFATAIVDYTADLSPDAAAQGLSKRLQEMLELQHAEAMWMGGEAAARYPDAQYAMAVLADELFTHMEWPGQLAWSRYLLEVRMFRTQAADVEFFKRVDRLLKNEAENPSRAARDLARLYLLVLASGFRGKYRQPNLVRPLAEYRRRLYEFIYEGDPLMLYASDRRLFPEATQRTLESRAVARFSGLQQWAAALFVILVGYTLLANFAWKRVSADLTDVTARVEAANRTSSSDGSWGSAREDSIR